MKTVTLARPVVRLANELSRGNPTQAAAREVLRYAADVREELEQHGDHFLSEADSDNYRALQGLLGVVQDIAGRALAGFNSNEVEALLAAGRNLEQRLARFEEVRRNSTYFPLPPLDRLLVACTSVLQGFGAHTAVERRIPAAELCVEELLRRFERERPSMPDKVAEPLELAFHRAQSGFSRLREWKLHDRPSRLGLAIRDLKAAGEFLAYLPRTPEPAERNLRPVGHIPVGGPELMGLARLAESGNAYWSSAARRVQAEVLPDLVDFWKEARESLLLPAHLREGVTGEVDELLERLAETLAAAEGPRPIARAVLDLDATFEFLDENRIDITIGRGTPLEPCLELLAGGVAGGIADVELRTLLHALGNSSDPGLFHKVLGQLQAYFQSYEPQLLVAALEELVSATRRLLQPERLLEQRTCCLCGRGFPDEAPCVTFDGAHIYLELSA
ncbi:MAG: hypothetical protein HY319_18955 [Armatimonadetes bacterium]|nr:hypothetical protein [Armatimonadota bacterium]